MGGVRGGVFYVFVSKVNQKSVTSWYLRSLHLSLLGEKQGMDDMPLPPRIIVRTNFPPLGVKGIGNAEQF